MLYFGLVALSFKVFGISEWSARLPAVLAALGVILLTYLFARRFFGRWAALWSGLILLTSFQFFGLARAVMLETLLLFFVTFALYCFFLGQHQAERGIGRTPFLLMYAAMGAGTATKGPIGFLLPAAIIFFYILFEKRWVLLRSMEFPLGIPLFILTAVPWYLLAELRNPGYLQYFLWEENVVRFTTTHFNRNQPWYFFILVLAGGFFPWSVLLPSAMRYLWKRSITCERLFLVLWMMVPLIVFSLSSAKLAHYILPVFPALAIIVGAMIGNAAIPEPIVRRVLWFPPMAFFLLALAPTLVAVWPRLLPDHLQAYVRSAFPEFPAVIFAGLALSLMFIVLSIRRRHEHVPFVLATAATFAVLAFLAQPIIATVASHRSSKLLTEQAAPLIRDGDQVAQFGGYPSSLPFYLGIQRPIAVILRGEKHNILGSDYVALKRPPPALGYGKVLYSFQEFAELWKTSENRIVIFVDKGAMHHLDDLPGDAPRTLLEIGDVVLVENRPVREKDLSDLRL
jgi:asparagine N-glycosylation enzyme membrane subunit Stt3